MILQPAPSDRRHAEEILNRVGVYRKGHFITRLGLHSDHYVFKDALFPDLDATNEIADLMARSVYGFLPPFLGVVGPAVAGAFLAREFAHAWRRLTSQRVFCVYAERRSGGALILSREYDQLVAGKDVVVVEDVGTEGGSAKEAVEATRAAGGNPHTVAFLANRGNVTPAKLGVENVFALVAPNFQTWPEHECPKCRAGDPYTSGIGRGPNG